MRVRDCDADHPLLWPIRPIARVFCAVYRLSPHSKFAALTLLTLSCVLLFISYAITHQVSEIARDLIQEHLGKELLAKAALAGVGVLVQLITSNSSFYIFRRALEALVYAIYELGRDTVFSILLLVTGSVAVAMASAYYLTGAELDKFGQEYKLLIAAASGLSTLTSWYWTRYIYKQRSSRTVFDHEVGSALAQLRN